MARKIDRDDLITYAGIEEETGVKVATLRAWVSRNRGGLRDLQLAPDRNLRPPVFAASEVIPLVERLAVEEAPPGPDGAPAGERHPLARLR